MSDNPKYYLGFIYTPDPQVGLHCTHCYFGTLNRDKLDVLVSHVQMFFNRHSPVRMPQINFNIPTILGDEERVRVLCTRDIEAFDIFRELRAKFGDWGWISNKYVFRPHITTQIMGSINQPFYAYALVKDGQVVKSWPFEKNESDG